MRADCILSKTSPVHIECGAAPVVAGALHSYYPHFLIANFALTAIDVRRTCA